MAELAYLCITQSIAPPFLAGLEMIFDQPVAQLTCKQIQYFLILLLKVTLLCKKLMVGSTTVQSS